MAATLTTIRSKVRQLTRSPSTNQLSDTAIDDAVNTFILYDLPEHLRLWDLHTYGSITLSPYQEEYDLSTINTSLNYGNESLSNVIITIDPPIYIDGYKAFYTQSRDEFYNIYPNNQNLIQIGAGDGSTLSFSYTVANGYLTPGYVMVSSIDSSNEGIYMNDDGNGTLINATYGTGTVDYITGEIIANFSIGYAPASGQPVYAHVVQYTPARPSAVLYYQNSLFVRPIPDQNYSLNFQYYVQPTSLLESTDVPQLKQWWQYIAYGATKKIFENRMDLDSVQQIMPEYKQQERLVLRRTLVQLSNQRVATIYTEQAGLSSAFSNFYNGF